MYRNREMKNTWVPFICMLCSAQYAIKFTRTFTVLEYDSVWVCSAQGSRGRVSCVFVVVVVAKERQNAVPVIVDGVDLKLRQFSPRYSRKRNPREHILISHGCFLLVHNSPIHGPCPFAADNLTLFRFSFLINAQNTDRFASRSVRHPPPFTIRAHW